MKKYHAFRYPSDEDGHNPIPCSEAYLGVFDTSENALLQAPLASQLFTIDTETGALVLFAEYEWAKKSSEPSEVFFIEGWRVFNTGLFIECKRTRVTHFGKAHKAGQ